MRIKMHPFFLQLNFHHRDIGFVRLRLDFVQVKIEKHAACLTSLTIIPYMSQTILTVRTLFLSSSETSQPNRPGR